jgi:hypothetical protein
MSSSHLLFVSRFTPRGVKNINFILNELHGPQYFVIYRLCKFKVFPSSEAKRVRIKILRSPANPKLTKLNSFRLHKSFSLASTPSATRISMRSRCFCLLVLLSHRRGKIMKKKGEKMLKIISHASPREVLTFLVLPHSAGWKHGIQMEDSPLLTTIIHKFYVCRLQKESEECASHPERKSENFIKACGLSEVKFIGSPHTTRLHGPEIQSSVLENCLTTSKEESSTRNTLKYFITGCAADI